jgi:L-2-hydroxyglutarate oxidase
MLGFRGLWKVMLAHRKAGLEEFRNSFSKRGYLRRVRKYCPRLAIGDLSPHPVGIRAQAVKADGSLVHDFLFAETERSLHVCNAPSPAATSAMPIGDYLCGQAQRKFGLDGHSPNA